MTSVSDSGDSRKGHAVMDLGSRQWKALKIEKLLGLDAMPGPLRMLEVGTGSGGIASYFGSHPSGKFEVDAVDVEDSRLAEHGYRFALVPGTDLPFPDGAFDVVLSNHVIEHVGDEAQQRHHLLELRRVMRPDGVGYLAVPNRWMLVEPHYGLAFLSWLPASWRNGYLKYWRGVERYDCEPLELAECERLLALSGFDHENICLAAMRLTFEIERPESIGSRILASIPDAVLAPFARVIPTLIYRIRPRTGG